MAELGHGRLDLLKMDAEGVEHEVHQSMSIYLLLKLGQNECAPFRRAKGIARTVVSLVYKWQHHVLS